MEDNRRKLYNALSKDYDMGTFDQFCKDIQDEGKRKKLYDVTSKEYDYGSYDSFSKQLGISKGKPTTTQGASVPQQPIAKPQQVAANKAVKGTSMTPAEKAGLIRSVGNMVDESAAAVQQTVDRMKYAKANKGLDVKPKRH